MKMLGVYIILVCLAVYALGASIPESADLENVVNGTQNPLDSLPGFRTRLTQKGFDYASKVAIDLLMRELTKEDQGMPDIRGSIGPTKVAIKNIRIIHFDRPETKVFSVKNHGLRWAVSGLTFNMSADYAARFSFGFFSIRKVGSVLVDVRNLSFNADFLIARDDTGRPKVYNFICSAWANDISLAFSGDWSDMLNIGANVLKSRIRDTIEAQVCYRAKEEMSTSLDQELSTLPLKVTVDEDYEIDFRLTRSPVFTAEYVGTDHKGDIELKGDDSGPDYQPSPIPEYPEHTDKMFYLYVTDFVINSGFDAAFRNDKLKIDLPADKLPPKAVEFFSPSCESLMCLNTIFSQITDMYPRGEPFLSIRAAHAPLIHNNGDTHRARAVGQIDVYMVQDGQRHFVFTLETTAVLELDVQVNGNRLMFNVTDVDHDTEMKNSTVGNILTGFLFETAIGIAIEEMALPELRKVGWEGIPLPVLEHVELVNSEIIDHEAEGVVIVGSDIRVKSLPEFDLTPDEEVYEYY